LYPFFLEGAALNADLMQKDGIHPNGKGVTVIVDKILPQVEALVLASQADEDG
jgi:acyl-CoA thioesterase-1